MPASVKFAAATPTEFELLAAKLGVSDDEAAQRRSKALREWARKKWRARYVPESLLLFWGMATQYDLDQVEL